MIFREHDLVALIEGDKWMMTALNCVKQQQLPDCWIVAGFVRAKVWDSLHDYPKRTQPGDIDVVFFDPAIPKTDNQRIEKRLLAEAPEYPWEVKNQAYKHINNGDEPYHSSVDAFSRWSETVSTVGVKLDDGGHIAIAAPHGLSDLFNMIIRPTPHPDSKRDVFQMRLETKGWRKQWPKVTVETN